MLTKRKRRSHRRAAVLVEVALISPLAMLLILGLMVGGVACFRAHQVNTLASEGARWASLHGPKYSKSKGRSLPTANEIYTAAMEPLANSLDVNDLSYDVAWGPRNATVTVNVRYTSKNRIFGRVWASSASVECPVSN